jgi:hypothetical protein
MLGVATIGVAIYGAENYLQSDPYADLVSRLKPGMKELQVKEELGEPMGAGQMVLLPNASHSMMYEVQKGKYLIIGFGVWIDKRYQYDLIDKWCSFASEKAVKPDPGWTDYQFVCHDFPYDRRDPK